MNKEELKGFVNKLFIKKGLPPIKNFGREFADGIAFQAVFNILFDEKFDCKLIQSELLEDRLLNWNRINS